MELSQNSPNISKKDKRKNLKQPIKMCGNLISMEHQRDSARPKQDHAQFQAKWFSTALEAEKLD